MSVTYNFHDGIDLPKWHAVAPSPSAGATGTCMAGDLRNDPSRDPHLWELSSAALLHAYNIDNDGWNGGGIVNPGLTGTFGAGANIVLQPHRGPQGTITAAVSGSEFTLSTLELAASVSVNQFTARGDGTPFKIRVYDPTNGNLEETYVTSNTAGTTPQITVSPALTFTPSTSAVYEFLSGRVYMISAGTLAAGYWKYYDILLNTMSGNLSTTNLVAMATDSALLCMDEQYVPCNQAPGAGYFGQITATAAAAGTITGSVAGADSALAANEFRNFQIRIVQDLTNYAAVGQRRRISSHTAGPSVVYTINTNWTTTPSSSAVFVIENNSDILLWIGGQTNTFAYHADALPMNVTANTWDTTTYAARGTAIGLGTMTFMPHGIANAVVTGLSTEALYGTTNDPNKNFRYSYIHSFRGGATVLLDIFDLAGGTTGLWTNSAVWQPNLGSITTGSCGGYDGIGNNGAYYYVNYIGGQYFWRYNVFARNLDNWVFMRYPTATAVVGAKMEVVLINYDSTGPSRLTAVYTRKQTGATTGPSTELFRSLIMT